LVRGGRRGVFLPPHGKRKGDKRGKERGQGKTRIANKGNKKKTNQHRVSRVLLKKKSKEEPEKHSVADRLGRKNHLRKRGTNKKCN